MKKFALKGLVVLAGIVLLCIFFSGTLHTITTAKVRLAGAKNGRFEMKITMNGKLQWPETENVTVEGMGADDTLEIVKLSVSAGSYVREGNLIAECIVRDYDSRMTALQDSCSAKEKELLELERKTDALLLTDREREWFSVYQQLQETARSLQTARQDLRLEAWKAGIILDADDHLPDDGTADETLQALRQRTEEAEAAYTEARQAYDRLKWVNISEDLITDLEKTMELKNDLSRLAEEMLALRMLQVRAARITAPWDGFITAADLKAGDQLSGSAPLVTITARDTAPVIRLNPGENKRSIAVGTPVTLSADGQTVETVISSQGIQASGGMYLDAALKPDDLSALGGVSAVTDANSVSAVISWKAENSTTLIPASAVRGTEGNYYIFVAQTSVTTLGAEKMTAVKKIITVLGISGSIASVQEDLRGDSIVYMEDRALTEGCEIMLYGST